MSKGLCFAALATALSLAFAAPAAHAATPKDTVVIAWDLSPIMTFDPANPMRSRRRSLEPIYTIA